jgi:signal recognition particle subunit SRP54
MLNGPRRRRIAAGCGQSVQEVNQFLNEFEQMRKMIRSMMGPGGQGGPGKKGGPGGGGGMGSLIRRSGPKMPTGGKGGLFRNPFNKR